MIRTFAVSSLFALLSIAPMAVSEAIADTATSQPIRLAWDAALAEAVSGYVVRVGTKSGVYNESYDVQVNKTFSYAKGVAGQRYYFAVSAYRAGIDGALSGEVSAVAVASSTGQVPPPPPPPPAPPSEPAEGDDVPSGIVLETAVIRGSTATFQWAPTGSSEITEYLLEVGSSRGASDLANSSVGTATSAVIKVERGRTYHVRVRGRLSATSSLTSNDVTYSSEAARCSRPPATPTKLVGSVASGKVTLGWRTASGATSYIVQLGSMPGMSDLFLKDIGKGTNVTSPVGGPVPAYARIIAVNTCGTSAASAEIVLK
jgi:hypothetical protein